MIHRLFIAIPIPKDIKESMINKIDLPRGFKITKPDNLHITLLFLGDVEDSQIPDIQSAIENAITTYNEFELSIDGSGGFPARGTPRIVYVTGKTGRSKLESLANSVRNNLQPLGFKDKKKFAYHITVGRNKFFNEHGFEIPDFNMNYHFPAKEVILYKSELQPTGPIYTKLGIYKL